jgi:hypothetical protein
VTFQLSFIGELSRCVYIFNINTAIIDKLSYSYSHILKKSNLEALFMSCILSFIKILFVSGGHNPAPDSCEQANLTTEARVNTLQKECFKVAMLSPAASASPQTLWAEPLELRNLERTQGLRFPFPVDADCDLRLINHLKESPLKATATKPRLGKNGITRLLPGLVLKAGSLQDIKNETLVNLVFKQLGINTPEVFEVGSEAKAYVSRNIDDFRGLGPNDGLLAMSRIRGVTFQDVLKQDELKSAFIGQFASRMQELGSTAVMDLLVSNRDRLIKFTSTAQGPRLDPCKANFGNWMYTITENKSTPGDRDLGEFCAIDNGSFEWLASANMTDLVSPFVQLLEDDMLDSIAERVLKNLNAAIDAKATRRGEHPFCASLGQDSSIALRNIKIGLLKGREMLSQYGEELEKVPTSTEEERLLLDMIVSRRKAAILEALLQRP